jgi:hypothetical protein
MCHVAVFWISRVNEEDSHGPMWHKWVEKANSIHPEFGKITVYAMDRPIDWKYIYKCGCPKLSGVQIRKYEGGKCKTCKSPYILV